MMLAYAGASAGLLLLGQQSGEDMIRAALGAMEGDPQSAETVLRQAQRAVDSGLSLPQAAVLIGVVPIVLKLLQLAKPWSDAGAEWWRRKILGEAQPPAGEPPK
jgi:hypothetical protein